MFWKIHGLLTPAERRRAIVLLGLLCLGMIGETLGIGLVVPAMALLLQPDIPARFPSLQPLLSWMGDPSQARLVTMGMLFLVAIFALKAAFLHALARHQMRFAFDVQVQLSRRLFATYLLQPYTFHLQRNSAQLISNAVTEVNVLTYHCTIPGIEIIAEGLVLLGLGALLLFVEPAGTVISIVVLGSGAWLVTRLTGSSVVFWGLVRQRAEAARTQTLQQGLGAAKDVKLLGREADFLEQYRVHVTEASNAMRYVSSQTRLPRLWLEVLAVAGLAVVVITMIARGEEMQRIVPTVILFGAVAFRLMPSVNRVLVAAQSIRYSWPVIDAIAAELSLGGLTAAASRGSKPTPLQTDIRLEQVSFTYEGSHTASVRELSVRISKGEFVGFIGPSGSGKSTLIDIILGLLDGQSGRVLVDDVDIRGDRRRWQDQIGYVPQSIYLTDDTITRNVAFGLPPEQIDPTAVSRAIHAAQLGPFVERLPLGLNTIVGERGVRLSGGQVQRIGIARALYHDPSVLVLDEASSSLDADTEREVMDAVTALQGSKTIVIVAHRMTTVARCDRIYRMEEGRITAEGAPDAMLRPTLV